VNKPPEEPCIDAGTPGFLAHHIPMPAFLVDSAGNIAGWNPLMEKLTSAQSPAAIGQQYQDFVKFTGIDGKRNESLYTADNCIKLKCPAAREGIFLASQEGRRIPVNYSALPVRAGTSDMCLFLLTDCSLPREMNSFKKEFISLISHDLKNPISMISTYGELLKTGSNTRSEDEELFLEQILLATSLLGIQINNIVNAARLLNGISSFDSTLIDLGQVAADTVKLVDCQRRAREVEFALSLGAELWVQADAMKLQEVIINLLSNAVHFSPKGSIILIEAVRKREIVKFTVIDRGKGLDMDELPFYFKPFEKGRGERSGAGLGLFIAAEYLKAHGAELIIESRKGEGCTAFFSLPYSPPVD